MDFNVDFDAKQFRGNIVHTIDCHESTDRVVMDYVGVDIQKVSYAVCEGDVWSTLTYFEHTDLNANLGHAVEMVLPHGKLFLVLIYSRHSVLGWHQLPDQDRLQHEQGLPGDQLAQAKSDRW
jgi:hypothetical protein